MSARVEVIAGPDGAPWAIVGAETAADTAADTTWCGYFEDLKAIGAAGELLPADAIFCAELTRRWKRLVVCSRAFLAKHADSRDARPSGFLLEVMS